MKMNMMISLFLFFLSGLPAHIISPHSSPSYSSDQHALLSFKHSLSIHSLHDWSPHHNTCNWTGVACSSRRPRVVSLNLTGTGLGFSISPFLANLSFLRLLDLSHNNFEGQIPPQLGRLFRLQILRLSYNHLSGSIPSQLGLLHKLKNLYLGANQLTGTIPSSLGNLSSLTALDFPDNRLHGGIPLELARLTQLSWLGLYTNNLTGPIPAALSNCSHLQVFELYQNDLTGHIPSQFGKLSVLQELRLFENQLTGEIPSSLSNCSLLQMLELDSNRLTGHIPSQFGKLSVLQELYLWGNNLTGEIPSSLSNCSLLQMLELNHNQLSGTVPLEFGKLLQLRWLCLRGNQFVSGSSGLTILTALTNCSYLEELDLFDNHLSGILPSSVGRLSKFLRILDLSSNKIEGNIPREIGNITKLSLIDLSGNSFKGTIPSTLSQLPHLERLYLDKNNLSGGIPQSLGQVKSLGLLSLSENILSGKIPDSLGNLPQLRDLILHHNQFSGKIPANLGRCRTLELVDMSYNKLRGNIPPEFAGLQNLQFYFNISNNSLEGSLLVLSKMVMVQAIDVSLNHFSGEIPASLSSCTNLQYLNLSWNSFDGTIPTSLTKLKNLEDIDLSRNNFSGAIPMAFKDMKTLQHINLSSNRLSGEVPKGGVFVTLNESAITGNQGLCGTWINLQPCYHTKHKHHLISNKVIVPVVIGILIFIMSLILFLYTYRRRHASQNIISLEVGPTRISYEELVHASGGFSQSNLLGVGSFGSVYKGTLNNGSNIAIKVLNLQDESAHQSFFRECNVLKRVRHRNVIRIISACSNLDFKALILPFMSNGSLERWLYPQEEDNCRLNFSDRFKIAMEIAQGMAYLHHQCFEQVIHCDLKPNNVLVGDDMTPHIADFGIAKLVFGNSMDSSISTNVLKGSIGYIAPEYGMGGNISTKGDVYSYGILLLELLTRRRPTDDIFAEGMNLQKWVGMHFPNKIIEVVDNNLLRDTNEAEISMVLECLTQVMEIGLVCIRELPQHRPDMMKIVERLEKVKGAFLGTPRNFQLPIDISPFLENTSGKRNTYSGSHESWSTSTS